MTEQPSIVFLNGMGHVEISWLPANQDRMRQLIMKKMNEGIHFFIVKPSPVTLGLTKKRMPITSASQIGDSVSLEKEDLKKMGADSGKIELKDPELSELAAQGVILLTRRLEQGQIMTVGRAKTADEVMQHRTVATPAFQGG